MVNHIADDDYHIAIVQSRSVQECLGSGKTTVDIADNQCVPILPFCIVIYTDINLSE